MKIPSPKVNLNDDVIVKKNKEALQNVVGTLNFDGKEWIVNAGFANQFLEKDIIINLTTGENFQENNEINIEQQIKYAVENIIKDINDRKGLKQQWNQIDEIIKQEIKEKWINIIYSYFFTTHPTVE